MSNTQREHVNAVVIGAGQGGKPLATELAESGRKTIIVERKFVGGTCVNVGCTPTKTMVASARNAYLARRSVEYGVHHGDTVSVNMSEVRKRKQAIVESFREAGVRGLEQTKGLELVYGDARFTGANTLDIELRDGGNRSVTADEVFINAGCRPVVPQVPGLESVSSLDSTWIMELDAVPEHLVVIGGGYIGLEFGQMFRRFGSRVTIVQRGARLFGREDPDVADAVAEILREDGIDLLLAATTEKVEASGSGIALSVNCSDGPRVIEGTHLLVATGRIPNTEDLGLETAGIEVDERGFVRVDDRLRTTAAGVWALGDVKGGPEFTHISYDDMRIVRTNVIQKGDATTKNRMVPYTVFIDPQLGRIGLTETEARAAGLSVKIAKIPMTYVARALEMGETRGFMKAVVDDSTGRIVGAAILGIEGGEIMAMLQIAMMGDLHYSRLKEGTFAHPTLAESLNTLFTMMDRVV